MKNIRQNTLFTILTMVLSLAIFNSCDIKEDRDDCPCVLHVNLSQCLEDGFKGKVNLNIEGIKISRNDVIDIKSSNNIWTCNVPKEVILVTTIYQSSMKHIDYARIKYQDGKTYYKIPVGHPADDFYYHSHNIEAFKEFAYDTVKFKKGFAHIVIEPINAETGFPFKLELEGNSNGFCLSNDLPTQGTFKTPFVPDLNGKYSTIACRQSDNQLNIRILQEIDSANNRQTLKTIPLGQILEKQGYNWASPYLKDIKIKIDISNPGISVFIQDWSNGEYKKVFI